MRFCGHCGTPAAAAGAPSAPAAPAPAREPDSGQTDVTEALRSFVAGPVADRLVEAGGRLPEERRLITALFADVSGFTSLADRLDPEQLLEVIDPVISHLSSIVGRYEGYVEKFAGDALLALFGAPVAHEDDAERALLVALEMHAELARLCAQLPHRPELTLHVGVNSGHGIARILGSEARMDYAVLGDSVILAQRFESAAPPGETYVSETTMRLAHGRFEFEPVGELTLKGKAEPVPAWRLVARRAGAAPARRQALIGRESELAAATSVLGELADGSGGVVTITGEPGVGKSRLLEEVRARASERGVRWLHTRCLSYGASLAYWPYVQLLRDLAGIRAEDAPERASDELRAALAAAGTLDALPYFARLLGAPDSAEEVASLEPEAFRRGLHEAFGSWLRGLTHETPLALALEDFHWADSSSVALTTELARLCTAEPLALYLLARPEAGPLLADVAQDRREVRLEPLRGEGVRALVESALAGRAPQELVAFVERRTAGNPFFVEEVVRSLHERGALVREDGGWTMRRGWDARTLPTTIEEVLAARIDLLPRTAATVLQTASVIGRRVGVPLLRAVADAPPDLSASLDLLVASGLLDRADDDGDDVVAFHHALVQDATYSRLLRRRRRDLHRKVAEEAEALYGAGDQTIDLLARHLYLAEAGPKAVDYLRRAGERARRLFANEEAILHLTRAAELAPDAAGLTLQLANLHELVGDYDEALRLYTRVRDQTSDVGAWRGIAATLRRRGEYEHAMRVLDEAFASDALKGRDLSPLWLEAGWTMSITGRFDRAIDLFHAGLETAPGRNGTVAQLLLQLARAETAEGAFAAGLGHALDAQAIFEEQEELAGLATANRVAGVAHFKLGDLETGATVLRRGLELAQRTGNVEEIGACLINLGRLEREREAFGEAIACERRAIEEFERIGHGAGRAQGYANLADSLAHAGEHEEALRYCEKALELGRAIGHALAVADASDTLAFISLRRGRFSQAADEAERAAALYLEIGAIPQAAESLELAAEACRKAGDEERAREIASRARSLSLRAG